MAVGQMEEVYLRAYDTVSEARTSIGSYLSFIIAEGLIRASTGKRRIRSTSTATACRSGVIDRWDPWWRGHARKEIATAVDMTLCMSQSLDNAIALPTCQRQEQKRRGRHENLKRLTAVKDLNKKKSSSGPASRVHHFRNYGRDSTYQTENLFKQTEPPLGPH